MRFFFFFQAEDGIRDPLVTGVQTCALPIWGEGQVVALHVALSSLGGRASEHQTGCCRERQARDRHGGTSRVDAATPPARCRPRRGALLWSPVEVEGHDISCVERLVS